MAVPPYCAEGRSDATAWPPSVASLVTTQLSKWLGVLDIQLPYKIRYSCHLLVTLAGTFFLSGIGPFLLCALQAFCLLTCLIHRRGWWRNCFWPMMLRMARVWSPIALLLLSSLAVGGVWVGCDSSLTASWEHEVAFFSGSFLSANFIQVSGSQGPGVWSRAWHRPPWSDSLLRSVLSSAVVTATPKFATIPACIRRTNSAEKPPKAV